MNNEYINKLNRTMALQLKLHRDVRPLIGCANELAVHYAVK